MARWWCGPAGPPSGVLLLVRPSSSLSRVSGKFTFYIKSLKLDSNSPANGGVGLKHFLKIKVNLGRILKFTFTCVCLMSATY